MQLQLNFWIRVKFRAFGITFGVVERQGWLRVGLDHLTYGLEVASLPPPEAHVVLDDKGIKLAFWLG